MELSKKVQDLIKLEAAFQELKEKLGHEPGLGEWAGYFKQEELSFMARLEDGSAVSLACLYCSLIRHFVF